MRAFIAIDVPLQHQIKNIYRELKDSRAKLKLVEPENLHITLKFLGDITSSQKKDIIEILTACTSELSPIPFTVYGTGVFPNFNNIRIIWLGIKEGNEEIADLAKEIDRQLYTLGFKKEKSYTPHITISRMKSAQGKEDIQTIVHKHQYETIIHSICTKIMLKQSTLTSQGPIYQNLEVINI